MKLAGRALLLCLLAGHAAAHTAHAATLTGRVIAVQDGETLTLLIADSRQLTLRLTGIDAPAGRQPYGERSRESLGELCAGRTARVVMASAGRPGTHGPRARRAEHVYCGTADAGAEQVRRGMAWVARRAAADRALHALEAAARKEKRGLWRDPAPVAPWAWRARHRELPGAVPAAQGHR